MSSAASEFKNVVVVRFSVRNKSFEHKFLSNDRTRERWFRFRANLFRDTLGPSLNAQSVKPVGTFLYFDANDTELVSECLGGLNFTPIYSVNAHEKLMGERVLSMGLSSSVVLSRIDSDDIVEKDYFSKVNRLLKEHEKRNGLEQHAIVISKSGYRTNFLKMQRVFHTSPPFISQYFPHYVGQGAYFNHTQIDKQSAVTIDDSSAEWIQIIHGTNVANKFKSQSRGQVKKLEESSKTRFGELTDFDPEWFKSWAGIEPLPPSRFDTEHLPLEGLRAKTRFALRRLLGRA